MSEESSSWPTSVPLASPFIPSMVDAISLLIYVRIATLLMNV